MSILAVHPGLLMNGGVPSVNLNHVVDLVPPARPRHPNQVLSCDHSSRLVLKAQDVRGRDIPPRGVGFRVPERGEALRPQVHGQLGDRFLVHVLV